MTLLKTLIFTVLVPGTVSVWIPMTLLSPSTMHNLPLGNAHYAGGVFMAIGAAIYFWCAWDFIYSGRGTPAPIDPPKRLVVRGLYRFVRNPMYVGVLTLLLGEALWFESRLMFEYALVVFAFFFLFVFFYEEPTLRRKFGEAYRQYCRDVPRWIPRLSSKT